MASLTPHHNGQLRILAFGDSLTEGYTDWGLQFHPYGHALRSKLSELLPSISVKVDIHGQSGDCVLRSLGGVFERRLKAATKPTNSDLDDPNYDLIIILGGTNDLAYRVGQGLEGASEIFDQGLKPLYHHILHEAKSNLIVMTVPERAVDTRQNQMAQNFKSYRESLNDQIKTWAGSMRDNSPKVFLFDLAPKVPFVKYRDEDDETPFDPSIWSPDGLHMSSSGYDYVGFELASFIKDLI